MTQFIYTPNYFITGDIKPRRFCMFDQANDFSAQQATLGAVCIGVSQSGTIEPPGLPGSSALAGARYKKTMTLYGGGSADIALEAGVGGYGRGDFIKSDAEGRGIPCGVGDNAGAYALEECHGPGRWGRVLVLPPGIVAPVAGAVPASSSASPSV